MGTGTAAGQPLQIKMFAALIGTPMLKSNRRYLPVILIPFLVLLLGLVGYMLIEGWSFIDAFFMTVITLTTVGFGEVRPLSSAGRWFTVLLILFGVGTVVYSLSVVAEYLYSANVGKRLWRRRMQNIIDKMNDHVIVIGYGRVGQSAIESLADSAQGIALVENDEEVIQQAIDDGLSVLRGDATDDQVLQAAGIERARTMIVCTGDTANNLYIVLSARVLNPDIRIIARGEAASQPKMR
jgi:voltage-gated potassium channel